MNSRFHKALIPFSGEKPIVPGKGGGIKYWRQERENEYLRQENADLTKEIRRLLQEIVEQIIYVQTPDHSIEARQRAVSRLAGALKMVSPSIMTVFQIEDIHPALARLVAENAQSRLELTEEKLAKLPDYTGLRRKVRFQDLLSNRQFEVLCRRLAGYRNFEIAADLGLNALTVGSVLVQIRKLARHFIDKKEDTNGNPFRAVD